MAFGQAELGQDAPAISLKDPTGKTISLDNLKGNIVLLDFWASWCAPCRGANPELIDLYQKYATNGFEILSVSLDEDKERWKQAIQQDALPWESHVSDLQGWDSEIVQKYNVQGLPAQFLIDREGKIVALDLSVEELSDELEHLLINEAAVYPINASSHLFMNVFTKYEIKNEKGKTVKKGNGEEIDIKKLPLGKYNVIINEKDHWFHKVEERNMNVQFYPKSVVKTIKMTKAVKYEVSNMKGEVLLDGSGSEIDVSRLHIGVYYINMAGDVHKFLKK